MPCRARRGGHFGAACKPVRAGPARLGRPEDPGREELPCNYRVSPLGGYCQVIAYQGCCLNHPYPRPCNSRAVTLLPYIWIFFLFGFIRLIFSISSLLFLFLASTFPFFVFHFLSYLLDLSGIESLQDVVLLKPAFTFIIRFSVKRCDTLQQVTCGK